MPNETKTTTPLCLECKQTNTCECGRKFDLPSGETKRSAPNCPLCQRVIDSFLEEEATTITLPFGWADTHTLLYLIEEGYLPADLKPKRTVKPRRTLTTEADLQPR